MGALGLVALTLLVSAFPVTGNYKFKIVRSGSMEPSIKTGSIVMIKPLDNYKTGDVITFGGNSAKSKDPITHRIVDMRVESGNLLYITKGDANEEADSKEVKPKEVLGKVLFDVPYLGYAVATAQKPWGFAILIIVPAALIVFDEGKKIWKEVVKLKGDKQNGNV